jgi:D-lactate dehydrogenase
MPQTRPEGAAAIYLPACVNRIFGAPASASSTDAPTVIEALVALSARARKPVWIPPDAPGHCCGTPWASKGHPQAHALMAAKTADALWRWTGGGRLPVVVDASSCSGALRDEMPGALSDEQAERHRSLEILDSVDWLHDHLLPELDLRRTGSVGHGTRGRRVGRARVRRLHLEQPHL